MPRVLPARASERADELWQNSACASAAYRDRSRIHLRDELAEHIACVPFYLFCLKNHYLEIAFGTSRSAQNSPFSSRSSTGQVKPERGVVQVCLLCSASAMQSAVLRAPITSNSTLPPAVTVNSLFFNIIILLFPDKHLRPLTILPARYRRGLLFGWQCLLACSLAFACWNTRGHDWNPLIRKASRSSFFARLKQALVNVRREQRQARLSCSQEREREYERERESARNFMLPRDSQAVARCLPPGCQHPLLSSIRPLSVSRSDATLLVDIESHSNALARPLLFQWISAKYAWERSSRQHEG